MIHRIGRADVQRLAAEAASIVDVLPQAEYRELHLPGAIHIPLPKLAAEAPRRLEVGRPVVVYCYDHT